MYAHLNQNAPKGPASRSWPRRVGSAWAVCLVLVASCTSGGADRGPLASSPAAPGSGTTSPPGGDRARSEDACQSKPVNGFGFDTYGGWKGIEVAPTGRFTIQEVNNAWWFITPEGHALFANGSTGISPFGAKVRDTQAMPYHDHILAKFGTEQAWANATLERLCGLRGNIKLEYVECGHLQRFRSLEWHAVPQRHRVDRTSGRDQHF